MYILSIIYMSSPFLDECTFLMFLDESVSELMCGLIIGGILFAIIASIVVYFIKQKKPSGGKFVFDIYVVFSNP